MLKAAAYITALTASWAQSLFAVVLLETSSSVVYMNLLCFSPAETVTDLKCKDWRKSGHELENVLVCLDQKSHRTGPFRNNHVFSFFYRLHGDFTLTPLNPEQPRLRYISLFWVSQTDSEFLWRLIVSKNTYELRNLDDIFSFLCPHHVSHSPIMFIINRISLVRPSTTSRWKAAWMKCHVGGQEMETAVAWEQDIHPD